ncbi:MAG: hypothetical protein H0T89_04650 [Deltaproteobacteria bacterium]|nr:hypothetical protein [Deltaproteobacteria bacterium]
MSVIDLPPGIGLVGTPLGVFEAPRGSVRLSTIALVSAIVLGAITWYLVSRHPWRRGSATLFALPIAYALLAGVGFAIRRARVAVTRDGVRWGWIAFGFHQSASKIVRAHIYRDGIALEAKQGSQWFLAARDWDRFDALVRQVRRSELPIAEHAGKAPLRQRLQSYGRFLDLLLIFAIVGSFATVLWAS